MSVDLTPDEAAQIAAFPRNKIKRCSPGETSNWDSKPFRQRHSEMARKAAANRKVRQK